jgi:hypothetical protein
MRSITKPKQKNFKSWSTIRVKSYPTERTETGKTRKNKQIGNEVQ